MPEVNEQLDWKRASELMNASRDHEWLLKMAEKEGNGIISAGGLVSRLKEEAVATHDKDKVVYVVLHNNYGDQGVDFHGVFESREAAEDYVAEREPDEHERQWWDVVEEPVLSHPAGK